MKLDEGTWTYMGTNALGNGKFAPYVTTSVHAAAGPDTWSTRSYGGDTPADEASEVGYARVVGNKLIPLENDELQHEQALTYTSCTGPNKAGRYTANFKYTFPISDGRVIDVKSTTWFSEHGSHFVEDLIMPDGTISGRRSGITYPADTS